MMFFRIVLVFFSLSFLFIQTAFSDPPLRQQFKQGAAPTLADLHLGQKWQCSKDGISFIFKVAANGQIINLLEDHFGSIFANEMMLIADEDVVDYVRVHKEHSGLIIEQVIRRAEGLQKSVWYKNLPTAIAGNQMATVEASGLFGWRGRQNKARRVQQYYECPLAQKSPLHLAAKNIVKDEFRLPKMRVFISNADIKANAKYQNAVGFNEALRTAMRNIFRDDRERFTFVSVMTRRQDTVPSVYYDNGLPKSIKLQLEKQLNQPYANLQLITPHDEFKNIFPREKYWIFQLTVDKGGDQIFFIFVDRMGKEEAFNRAMQ